MGYRCHVLGRDVEEFVPSAQHDVEVDDEEVQDDDDEQEPAARPAVLREPVGADQRPGVAEHLTQTGHDRASWNYSIAHRTLSGSPRGANGIYSVGLTLGEVAEAAAGSRLLSGYRGKN